MEMAKLRKIRIIVLMNLVVVTLLVVALEPMTENSSHIGRYEAYGELCWEEEDTAACNYDSESRFRDHKNEEQLWLVGFGAALIAICIINLAFLYKNSGTVIRPDPVETVKEVEVEIIKEVIREVPVEIIREVIREVPSSNEGNIVINVDGKKVSLQDSVYTEK
jgi:hypothetical protein